MRVTEIALGRSVRYPFFAIFDVVQQRQDGRPGLKIRFQRRRQLPAEVLQSGIYAWHHPDWGYFYVGIASKNNFRERWYKHIQKLLDQCTTAKQMRNWKQFADRFAAAGYGVNDLKDITLRFFPIPSDLGDSPEMFKQKLGAIEDRIVAVLNPACNYQHDPARPSSTKYPTPRTNPTVESDDRGHLNFAGQLGRVGIKNKERILRAASYVNRRQPNHSQNQANLYDRDISSSTGLKPALTLSVQDTKILSQFLQSYFKNPKLYRTHKWLYEFLGSPKRVQALAQELSATPQFAQVIAGLDQPQDIAAFVSALDQIEKVNESQDLSRKTARLIAQELKKNMHDLMDIAKSGSNLGAGNPHYVQGLKQDIEDLQNQLTDLGFKYDPAHPELIKPLTQI